MSIKSFNYALNRIDALIDNPCGVEWHVYVKTAIPALGNALLMLITPQPDEIVEELVDPKKCRGIIRRAKQRYPPRNPGGGGRPGWGGWMNTNTWIADRLPGAKVIQGRKIGQAQYLFFTGFNIVERGLWYWLLYDVAEDFVFEWSSGVIQSVCKEPDPNFAGLSAYLPPDLYTPEMPNPICGEWQVLWAHGFNQGSTCEFFPLEVPRDLYLTWSTVYRLQADRDVGTAGMDLIINYFGGQQEIISRTIDVNDHFDHYMFIDIHRTKVKDIATDFRGHGHLESFFNFRAFGNP